MKNQYSARINIKSQPLNSGIVAMDNRIIRTDFTSGKKKDFISQTEKYYTFKEERFDSIQKTISTKVDEIPYQIHENKIVVFK